MFKRNDNDFAPYGGSQKSHEQLFGTNLDPMSIIGLANFEVFRGVYLGVELPY